MAFSQRVYYIIERVPEFPYFVFASYYVFTTPLDASRHVFSIGLIYMTFSIFVGLFLKYLLKTKRPKPYSKVNPFCFDVPSLHTMLAFGAVSFTYFVDVSYSIIFVPVSVLYFYSRLKLGFHTKTAIVVGAVVGLLLGVAVGLLLDRVYFSSGVETIMSILFFSLPVLASVFRAVRVKYPDII
jgi:membrane-associated phospholipid phosphatase